jgi:methyl coenzyme M reductase beta subunit
MVLSDEKKAIQLAQDNDQLAYFKFEDASTVETPKKSQATIKKLLIDSNRTAAAHLAEVNSALKIDDLLALTQKLTGRRSTPEEVARLEQTMGQKASDV